MVLIFPFQIIDVLWRKSGILLMDEVDVLLHPLRSELNFPIGHKKAIDLSGHRWDLPIHIMDAIFYANTKRICEPLSAWGENDESSLNLDPLSILHDLQDAIEVGYHTHRMQKRPHLVLLDFNFYHSKLKPILARWVLVWLKKQFVGRVTVPMTSLLKYLCLTSVASPSLKQSIDEGLLPDSLKLLNLAATWCRSILPHCLSKINRVSYGLLTQEELSTIQAKEEGKDQKTPFSRLVMAVPFIGKDVPSHSSEFAHPDVLIGLTVLAYRYEGLRESDLRRVVMQLKQDYSRQVGPRPVRPACQLFKKWIALASELDQTPCTPQAMPIDSKEDEKMVFFYFLFSVFLFFLSFFFELNFFGRRLPS